MFKKGTFANNFLVLFSGNTISQIVPILFVPILGRLFHEEEMAVRGNFFALAGMIAIVAAGRYEMAIVLPAEKKKAMNLMSISCWLTVIITILSSLIYFFREDIDRIYKEGDSPEYLMSNYLILILVTVPLYSFSNIFKQWLIREKKYKALTTSGIALTTFGNLFAMLFGYAEYGVFGLLVGYLIGWLVSLVMMYFSSRSSLDFSLVNSSERNGLLREYKDFPLINAPHAFVDILFTQFILYAIITREFGLQNLGWFFMMSTLLLGSMKAIGGAVGQLYYKEASDLYSGNQDVSKALFRSIKLVAIFAIPASLIVLFFGPQLFGWFMGEDYRESGIFAQIMILPFFINFIVSPISATPIIYRKQAWALVFSLIGYISGIAAILVGNYLDYDFYHTLILYATTQTCYYLWLLLWYIKLTRHRA